MAKLAINGGGRSCNVEWPTWPVWDEQERTGLMEVLESGKWWYGQRVQEFEEKFAAFQDARFGVTTTSGSTALEVALRALEIGEGDEVIMPPYTFVATATSTIWTGARCVFADILPDTLCIDPSDVESKITPRTRAIVPVHLAGHIADMDALRAIARRHKLALIEDACHSWGSRWKGKGSGALGDCGVFSFQMSKNICAAEGGIILSDNEKLADTCRSLANCGRTRDSRWYEHKLVGSNLRMTEFQAALLLAQLSRVADHALIRRRNALILNDALRAVPGIRVFDDDPRMSRRAYHLYCFQLDTERLGISRQQFLEALEAEGVPASGGYLTPVYRNPMFQPDADGDGAAHRGRLRANPGGALDYSSIVCPVTEYVCRTVCWLNHVMLLAAEDAIRAAAEAIAKVCANAAELCGVEMSVKKRPRARSVARRGS